MNCELRQGDWVGPVVLPTNSKPRLFAMVRVILCNVLVGTLDEGLWLIRRGRAACFMLEAIFQTIDRLMATTCRLTFCRGNRDTSSNQDFCSRANLRAFKNKSTPKRGKPICFASVLFPSYKLKKGKPIWLWVKTLYPW